MKAVSQPATLCNLRFCMESDNRSVSRSCSVARPSAERFIIERYGCPLAELAPVNSEPTTDPAELEPLLNAREPDTDE